MLDQLRQGAQGWVSKVLMILLVLSFAVWGIGGFQGYGSGTVATVGNTEVSAREFARVYEQVQRNSQQAGRQFNPEQVLGVVLNNAALDDAASEYGLGVSGDRVAAEIGKNPIFQREDGSFDRERFTAILANANLNRDDFVHDTRRELIRNQISDTLSAGLAVPQPIIAALYRLQNEERTISYFAVDTGALIPPVGTPSDSDLQTYFDENKERFRAPEYRKLAILSLDPVAIADPNAIAPEEVNAEYERRKPSLTQPERRGILQIRFTATEAAEAAMKEIEAGKDFSAIPSAGGPEVTDLGIKTKAEVLDPAIAEAAFGAEVNQPVLVVENALEPSIVQVVSIEPESVMSLAEAEPGIRKDIAARAAHDEAVDLYNKVEDERAGGSTLEEAAAKLDLPYRVVDAVSATMTAPDGSTIADIPAGTQVVKEAFDSDVGVENSPIRGEGSLEVFFDVLEIIPARDRTLDEVRDQVVAVWTMDETERRLAELANTLLERLKTGATLASLAAEMGKTVQTVENVKRNQPPEGLSANAVSQAFAGPEGHVANADGNGAERILLRVDKVVAPAFFAEAADAQAISQQLVEAMKNDLLITYNKQLLDMRPPTVNNAVYQQLTGQTQTQTQ